MYVASLYPDRISVRYDNDTRSVMQKWEDRTAEKITNSLQNLEKVKTTWKLSYQTKRKMRDSVAYMSAMSPSRTIYRRNGKKIYNFKTSFITLTLPSKQIHTDKKIKQCLNNFLTTMRTRFNLKNYVWKAELQENENIHFHLIFDIYIEHTVIRYYWNKALNVLGYVDKYAERFKNLSLKEYAELRQVPVSQAVSGYLFGRDTDWMSPGTENVKSIQSCEMVSYYLSKYISKDVVSDDVVEEDLQRIKAFGRVWGRSQSLSRISYVTRYCWSSLKSFIKTIDENFESLLQMDFDYCTVYYFRLNNGTAAFRKWVRQKMTELAYTYEYTAPT